MPFLGRVPIDPGMVAVGDDGPPFVYNYREAEAARAMEEILRNVLRSVEGYPLRRERMRAYDDTDRS